MPAPVLRERYMTPRDDHGAFAWVESVPPQWAVPGPLGERDDRNAPPNAIGSAALIEAAGRQAPELPAPHASDARWRSWPTLPVRPGAPVALGRTHVAGGRFEPNWREHNPRSDHQSPAARGGSLPFLRWGPSLPTL